MILAWQPLGETESESGLERCKPEFEREIQIALARARSKLVQNPSEIRGWPVVVRGLPGQTAGRPSPRRTKRRELRFWPVRPTRERESCPARGETRGGAAVPVGAPSRKGRARRARALGRNRVGKVGRRTASTGPREGRSGQATPEQA